MTDATSQPASTSRPRPVLLWLSYVVLAAAAATHLCMVLYGVYAAYQPASDPATTNRVVLGAFGILAVTSPAGWLLYRLGKGRPPKSNEWFCLLPAATGLLVLVGMPLGH